MTGKNRIWALGATASMLGFLVACGTAGENTGFKPPIERVTNSGAAAAAAATAAAAAAGVGSGTGNLTGGANGTAVVNPDLAATPATGLTVRNSLVSAGNPNASNAATRLALGEFGTLGRRAVVVQGYVTGNNVGRVTLLPRNPGNPDGAENIEISGANSQLLSPFGLAVRSNGGNDEILVTNQVNGSLIGELRRIRNIQDTGAATISTVASNLNFPFDIAMEGEFAFVCENAASVGRILRINVETGASEEIMTGLQNPSALALDTSFGRRLLYVAENGNIGLQLGRVLRIDLQNLGPAPRTPGSAGVAEVVVPLGEDAFNNPFDLALDGLGNLVISEGTFFNATDPSAPNSFAPITGIGRIRVMAGAQAGTLPPSPECRLVLRGLSAPRGLSVIAENAAGTANTVFFVEGVGTTSSLRQLTFNNTDRGIFRHLILDQGASATLGPLINPFDTLFDPGSATPLVPSNVKYSVGFLNPGFGRVRDVR